MNSEMKNRYRAFRRGWGVYYCEDTQTGKQESLATSNRKEAERLVHAKNESEQHPAFSLHLARVYWKAGDPAAGTRTWQFVMDEILKTKQDNTRHRWETAVKDPAFNGIRNRVILETSAEHFLRVLENGTVSTNIYLRRIHNFALDMSWLPWPVVPKKQWPPVQFGEKRAITRGEHEAIVAREGNPERKAFYQLAWHLGASQTDVAPLESGNIDWQQGVISYTRKKTGESACVRLDEEVAHILRSRPSNGPLFPYLCGVREADRATEFKQRCRGLGIEGVTLHSYRYAWAYLSTGTPPAPSAAAASSAGNRFKA